MKPAFTERTEKDPMHYSYATEIETLLKQSKTENTQYDFKQGIYDLVSGKRNDRLINKIFKTLTAMGNSEKNAVGAERISRYKRLFSSQSLEDA